MDHFHFKMQILGIFRSINTLRKFYKVKKFTKIKIEKNICTIIYNGVIKKWFIFNLVFLLLVPFSFAQEMVTTSEIKEVTLFSHHALVKRESIVRVNKGLNKLFLELKEFHVEKDSISAKIFGEGEILSVQSRDVYLKESLQEGINTLEQKVKKLKESKRILMDKKDVLNKKELFLNSFIDLSQPQFHEDIKAGLFKITDLEKHLSFIASNFQDINEKKGILDLKIEEIDNEIKTFEKELAFLKASQTKGKKVIEIFFNSTEEQEIKIVANYLVQDAFWKPLYKISIPTTLKEANLIMFSKIQQKTGEDWKNVTLSISNVMPLKGVALSSPKSWLLDVKSPRQKPIKPGKWLSFQREIHAPFLDDEMEELTNSEEVYGDDVYEDDTTYTYAQKEELAFYFEYKIPQEIDIESKDKETILPIFSKKLKGEFFYYSIPRTNALTFLVFKASADNELLSGPLNVFLGSRFIGKTILNEKKAGEEFYLNLGADREIKVKREKIKDRIIENIFGRIESNSISEEMIFKITLENLKEKPIEIKVFDNIPVSVSNIVEVKDISITPEPIEKNYQEQAGVLLWEFALNPGEKQEVTINFVVIYPKDLQLIGL